MADSIDGFDIFNSFENEETYTDLFQPQDVFYREQWISDIENLGNEVQNLIENGERYEKSFETNYGLDNPKTLLVLGCYLGIVLFSYFYFKGTDSANKCSGWEGYGNEWRFHAGPYKISRHNGNPRVQSDLLGLFRAMGKSRSSITKKSSDEEIEYDSMGQFFQDIEKVNEMCPRKAFFTSLAPRHNSAVVMLQKLFLAQKSQNDFINLAKRILIGEMVHPRVWYLALLAASLERMDMINYSIPHPIDAMPDTLLPAEIILDDYEFRRYNFTRIKKKSEKTSNKKSKKKKHKVRKKSRKRRAAKSKSRKLKKGKKKKCLLLDDSIGEDNGEENKLWYFREDIMLNQYHLYWHTYFPMNSSRHGDRRGELFFFAHREMVARYNAERISNGLRVASEQEIFHGAFIPEGYNSHLVDSASKRFWTPRTPMTRLTDAIHEDDLDFKKNIYINNIRTLMKKVSDGIRKGKLVSRQGPLFPISIKDNSGSGINPLADTIEASELSVNPLFYDAFGLHNQGHQLIGLSADPKFRKRLPTGVMSDASVSMRDPVFYTYHTLIDNLFEKYKQTLPSYRQRQGPFPLAWDGVEIARVEITSKSNKPTQTLYTFFTKHKFELTAGVDGTIENAGKTICAKHMDHKPFSFKITIDRNSCAKSKSGIGTVRIFMAPRYNENGERLKLPEQRRLFFILDTFQAELKIGRNVITRRDRDSALTIPWTKSLKEMEKLSGTPEHCGCGWPRHLYIPRGNEKGVPFDIFVMVTSFDNDRVGDNPRDLEIPESCIPSYIFCGKNRRRYPDSKPMGYPFDRPIYQDNKPKRIVWTLEEFVNSSQNMGMTTINIKHLKKDRL